MTIALGSLPLAEVPWSALDWALLAGAGALALAGLCLLWLALWRDRSKGRPRCPKCWYDLSSHATSQASGPGFTPLTCPECGRVSRRRGQLFRTRRRWGVAFLAMVVMLAAGGMAWTPTIKRSGWGAVPTWGLWLYSRVAGAQSSRAFNDEVYARVMLGRGTGWMLRDLACDQRFVRWRSTWPKQVPVYVLIHAGVASDGELVSGTDHGASGRALSTGDEPISPFVAGLSRLAPRDIQTTSWAETWSDGVQAWPPGTIPRLGFGMREPFVWADLPIRFVERIDDVLVPVTSPRADADVRARLLPRVYQTYLGEWELRLTDVDSPVLDGVVIAVRAEILDGQEVIASVAWWQRAGRPCGCPAGASVLLPLSHRLVEALVHGDDPRYTVRFTSDPEMALRDFDATKYWKGSFTLPLRALLVPSAPEAPLVKPGDGPSTGEH